jgi:hypothetical protein
MKRKPKVIDGIVAPSLTAEELHVLNHVLDFYQAAAQRAVKRLESTLSPANAVYIEPHLFHWQAVVKAATWIRGNMNQRKLKGSANVQSRQRDRTAKGHGTGRKRDDATGGALRSRTPPVQ